MECMYCYRKFSSKHSLATHKSRYHRPNFKSDCEDNEPFIRMMMKAILDGDIKLTKTEKNKLKPARKSIRKIVHQEENLVDIFDKSLERAIKLIITLVKQKFPTLIFENSVYQPEQDSDEEIYSDENDISSNYKEENENENVSNDETDDSTERSPSD